MKHFLHKHFLMQTEDLSVREQTLLSSPIPHHVAIIMDGNRRWAKQRGLPSFAGHWQGEETLIKIVRAAKRFGIKVLTVYAFSTENWVRSLEEVEELMLLFRTVLLKRKEEMLQEKIKLSTIGDLGKLRPIEREILEETKALTSHCDQLHLVIALNYGGRDDIRRATAAIVEDCLKGKLKKEEISEEIFGTYLDTAPWGDPDLLIRTSGEMRLSNFLLWQISYSEVYITDVLWPDFDERELKKAMIEYQRRDRRLGGP
jgi:undecaprenyl diphosphate synthase